MSGNTGREETLVRYLRGHVKEFTEFSDCVANEESVK